jgi:hypothetical protein
MVSNRHGRVSAKIPARNKNRREGVRGMRWLLLGLTVLVLIWAVALPVASCISSYAQLQGYQAGQCTIIAKKLLREEYGDTSGIDVRYRPLFQFIVQTTDGRKYRANGYDYYSGESYTVQSSGQAVIDVYRVKETYPCWYDPAHPTQAVLTRQFDWWNRLVPSVFVGIFIVIPLALAVWGSFLPESEIPETAFTVWGYTIRERDCRPERPFQNRD